MTDYRIIKRNKSLDRFMMSIVVRMFVSNVHALLIGLSTALALFIIVSGPISPPFPSNSGGMLFVVSVTFVLFHSFASILQL